MTVFKKPRHTSAKRRSNCIAIRKDLDPWYYPTLESLLSAVKSGTLRRECAIRNSREMAAADADGMAWA